MFAACCLISFRSALAKVAITAVSATPQLVNPSFEDPGETPDRAAGWSRWGNWFNREDSWSPVRSGRCILGYHHWQIPDASDSGVYQDVTNAVKGTEYTFGIFANIDKARPPMRDALTIELRLESLVDGQPQRIGSKLYNVADLVPDRWEKLTVAATPVNDSLRVLVIAQPSPINGTRGGAIRFDDAFLAPTPLLDSAIPKPSVSSVADPALYGNATVIRDIPYSQSDPHQDLDLYLPKRDDSKPPILVFWIHGGAWMFRNKDWNNVKYLVKHGYALASVDYRLSDEAVFPAQIRDCNAALNFLLANADRFGVSRQNFVVGGASAGGQLALLLGLARNESSFGADPSVKPFAILDFFGPTDLTSIVDEVGPGHGREVQEDATQRLLGGPWNDRLDLARAASPVRYISRKSPPTMILHGDKDDLVPYAQSHRFHSLLDQVGVKNKLITVTGAGHDGPMFETPEIQQKVLAFLRQSESE